MKKPGLRTVMIGMIALAALAVWFGRSCVFGSDVSTGTSVLAVSGSWKVPGPSGRDYGEAELALASIVRNQFEAVRPWISAMSAVEQLDLVDDEIQEFHQLTGHQRERAYFEMQVEAVVLDALEELSSDLDLYEGTLAESFRSAVDECGIEHGIAQAGDVFEAMDWDALDEVEDLTGGTDYEELLEIRHGCARYASSYPLLSENTRDDLLARTESELTRRVLDWMRDNPDLVVPLEHHPGVNQPYADILIEMCKQAPDQRSCYEEVGVEP